MFTGLIEDVGIVKQWGRHLLLETRLAPELRSGDSLAVTGMCLSVETVRAGTVRFRLSPETLKRVRSLRTGERVNVERPVPQDGRLHGHLVTGHVDGSGSVLGVRRQGGVSTVRIACPARWRPLLVEKGSVAVDGISLTVASLVPGAGFTVELIPETLARTAASGWRPGSRVNLEFDILAKHVQRILERDGSGPGWKETLEEP